MVHRVTRAWPIVIALCLATSSRAGAYYSFPLVQDDVPDARAAAMGRAFTAVAEGAAAAWWNPGGLGLVREWRATPFSQAPGSAGLGRAPFRAYGIAGPLGSAGVGANYAWRRWPTMSGGPVTEWVLALGCGVDVVPLFSRGPVAGLQWGFGANLRRVAWHIKRAPGPEANLTAWDADLGTLVRWERPVTRLPALSIAGGGGAVRSSYLAGRCGIMVRNLFNHRMGPNRTPIGRVARGGLGVESGLVPAAPFGHLLRTLATVELEQGSMNEDLPADLKFGLEATVLGLLSWRYGQFDNHYWMHVGDGQGMRRELKGGRFTTQGFGLRFGGERLSLEIDYARALRGTGSTRLYTVTLQARP